MPASALRLAAALFLGLAVAGPAAAQHGLAGAYLAARQAAILNDHAAAAEWFTKALVRDPSNPALMEGALLAQLALGNLDAALPVAQRMRAAVPQSLVADLVLMADAIRREDFARIFADFDAGMRTGPLIDGLVTGWAHLAEGRVDEALAAFGRVAADGPLGPFGAYHKALALASVGDFEGADRLFALAEAQGSLSRRSVIAHAQVLGQIDRGPDALALLDRAFGADPDPATAALRASLMRGETPPFDVVTHPRDGLAEVFFTVAGVLNREADDSHVLIYSRLAEAVSPRHTDAILLTAAILERQEQFALATEAYKRIPRDDPAFHLAEIGRAEALYAQTHVEAALEVLGQLAGTHAQIPDVHRALGDVLRREERWDEASAAYDRAIAALPAVATEHWVLFFLRGITHERGGRWPLAEADLKRALELEPDQPQVLNYLGYSWLEQRVNLEAALAMIERAVAARPDDGYIVDSLGWALYRLGRFEEAVAPMERAVELEPTNPVITDHLGDVYWMVGRRTEARFQWRRALSYYVPGEVQDFDPERVRRKLEVGLDAVLAEEEAAAPLSVADDGGN